MKIETAAIDSIRRDGGTQMRVSINEDKVTEYADLMIDEREFPPVVVFFDGTDRWLADGFHRIAAREQVAIQLNGTEAHKKWTHVDVELRNGTKYDAIRYAISADSKTGLARSNEDKRKAVMAALSHPAMKLMSNREIAREVGVSDKTVAAQRRTAEVPQTGQPHAIITIEPSKTHDNSSTSNKKPHKAVSTKTDERTRASLSPEEEKARALELHSRGIGIAAIADSMRRNETTIRQWIANPSAVTKKRPEGTRSSLDHERVRALFDAGHSVAAIVAEMGVTRQTVGACLKNLGLSKAGKLKANPLIKHTSNVDAQACALETAFDRIANEAALASREQTLDLCKALGRLSAVARKLQVRLNKDAGKGE